MQTVPILHSRPTLGQEEIDAVAGVIASGNISQGEVVDRFERAMAAYTGVGGAVAAASGTACLHLALLAMGIGQGDEVVIPTYVCSALLHAVRFVGARPVPSDVDPRTCNMDPDDVRARMGPRTKAVIVPHLFGLPADLDALLALGVPVIEDCAQAVGGTYRGKKLGAWGTAAVFSFYATKVMTTGEGGMVVSNSMDLLGRVRDLRQYDNRDDPRVRYNYKMTDMQAAMGLVQLERLPAFVASRRAIAHRYCEAFRSLPLELPPRDPEHIYYRFVLRLKKDAGACIRALGEKGVHCARPVYKPVHRYLDLRGYERAEETWSRCVSIPLYPSLSEGEVERIVESVMDISRETIS